MDMDFDTWMERVDEILESKAGLSHDDLDDWMWADEHESGSTPAQAVEMFLEDMGFDIN